MSGSGISWDICKSARHSRQITTPAPHHSAFLQAGCPSCRPTNSVKALKAEEAGAVKSVKWLLFPVCTPAIYYTLTQSQTLQCNSFLQKFWNSFIIGYSPLRFTNYCKYTVNIPSVVWRCWLGGRKGIRPVKNWVVGCWRGYLSGARCRLAYGPTDATATHCLLLQSNPDWFNLSGTGSPG